MSSGTWIWVVFDTILKYHIVHKNVHKNADIMVRVERYFYMLLCLTESAYPLLFAAKSFVQVVILGDGIAKISKEKGLQQKLA